MNDSIAAPPPSGQRRLPTGDAGLDRILNGGLFRGAVAILQGSPGAGKTTLANQMAFANSRLGGRTLYITLLAESHGRLTGALRDMDFFVEDEIGRSIHYVSGYGVLLDEGTRGLLRLIGMEAKQRGANLVVLDGLFVLGETIDTESEYRRFINDLALQAELMGCTMLLLTNGQRHESSPEYTMVDGWISLGRHAEASRTARFVKVHKLRGSDFLPGRHTLRISGRGLEVFPRLESCFGLTPHIRTSSARLSTGVPDLDRLLEGGIPEHSSTLLWGASGTGKTVLGLHFMAGCTQEAPGLVFGFYETPGELRQHAHDCGIPLGALLDDGAVDVIWHPPTEHDLDELAHGLLAHVRRRGIRRLLLDGIEAFEKVALEPARLNRFLTALTYELRALGCTSMYVSEVPSLFGTQPEFLAGNRSAIGQNILLLRYTQAGAELVRTLSVVKVRESDFVPIAHEVRITAQGVRLLGPLDPLTTAPRLPAAGRPD